MYIFYASAAGAGVVQGVVLGPFRAADSADLLLLYLFVHCDGQVFSVRIIVLLKFVKLHHHIVDVRATWKGPNREVGDATVEPWQP